MGADVQEAGRRIERPTQTPARSRAGSQPHAGVGFHVMTAGQRARLIDHPAQLTLPFEPVQPKAAI